MTGVSECSQQRGSLKDDGYRYKLDFHTLVSVRNIRIGQERYFAWKLFL
ncbi:hypothetical protein [Photorhabdus bodei]|uniref:Transposase n=1 Tax=Photorhabdus bodei TaxID=2029681 RepID=A0ABX0AQ20_9GAMM|nr:hypothetical protein [Photorhabdus bodei]NDL00969.1 hypothetical protein [Photorhabdus bodei]NDL05170.1 hypothetical protein [Photorhabdus bodei]NDL08491.1 hypothetical protein [Photorhabdus bodei]